MRHEGYVTSMTLWPHANLLKSVPDTFCQKHPRIARCGSFCGAHVMLLLFLGSRYLSSCSMLCPSTPNSPHLCNGPSLVHTAVSRTHTKKAKLEKKQSVWIRRTLIYLICVNCCCLYYKQLNWNHTILHNIFITNTSLHLSHVLVSEWNRIFKLTPKSNSKQKFDHLFPRLKGCFGHMCCTICA